MQAKTVSNIHQECPSRTTQRYNFAARTLSLKFGTGSLVLKQAEWTLRLGTTYKFCILADNNIAPLQILYTGASTLEEWELARDTCYYPYAIEQSFCQK